MEFNFGTTRDSGTLRNKKEKKKASPTAGIIIGAIMLIVGVVAGISVVSNSKSDQNLIDTGVRTEAVVTNVEIDVRNRGNSNSNSNSNNRKSSKITTLSYTAENGQTYTTKFSEKHNNSRNRISISAEEDMGQKMTVFYDASNPNDAVVEGKESSATTGYVIGGGFLLFGLFVVISSVIQLKKKRNETE